ncbi:serine hydrolase domain-containing protein [Thermus filiformis]|uniref:Beta-lactamase n=1 Tax=Thermus filiformis TaxID=276 RepID=A0A0A2XBC5_THEFI|nr:serine hydrolase domain-containing protein [Thermus filiformis]KGQ22479.1 beta-lactamase [Thermus filiformis]
MKLLEWLKEEVERGSFPGVVAGVVKDGEVVFREAVGRMDPKGTPMRPEAVFRVYSMTKPWTSVLALSFVEEGRLSLMDPVELYFPAFRPQVAVEEGEGFRLEPPRRPVLVYDLLRHTSGLTYGVFFRSPVKKLYLEAGVDLLNQSREEFLEALFRLPLRFQPGSTFEYGLSTDLLGHLLEEIAGEDLESLMRKRLFAPLGMKDSGFTAFPDRLAQPFPQDPETQAPIRLIPPSPKAGRHSGGAGGFSTLDDYLRFAEMLRTRRGPVSPALLDYLQQDHLGPLYPGVLERGEEYTPGPGYTFGLGVAVRKEAGLSPGHPGEVNWAGLAGTYFFADPKAGLSAVLLVQAPSLLSVARPDGVYFSRLGQKMWHRFRTLVYAAYAA